MIEAIQSKARTILQQNPLFLDTETTGLGSADEVIEVAIIDQSGQILLEQLFKPRLPMSPMVIGIHGISNERLASAPTWAQQGQKVIDLLRQRLVVAHNTPFDERLIQQSSIQYGLQELDAEWLCTMQMVKPLFPDKSRVSLKNAMLTMDVSTLGIPGKAHRAAFDAECCRRLLMEAAYPGNSARMDYRPDHYGSRKYG